jgi:hypothetical protein
LYMYLYVEINTIKVCWLILSSFTTSSMPMMEHSLSLFHLFHGYALANEVLSFFRVDIMQPTVVGASL